MKHWSWKPVFKICFLGILHETAVNLCILCSLIAHFDKIISYLVSSIFAFCQLRPSLSAYSSPYLSKPKPSNKLAAG